MGAGSFAAYVAVSYTHLKVEISKAPWVTIQENVSNPDTTPNMISINSGPQYNEAGATLESYAHSKTCGTYENVSWLQNADLDKQIEEDVYKRQVYDLRIGTQELTRRGMVEKDAPEIAQLLARAILHQEAPESLKPDVIKMASRFQQLQFAFSN